MRAGLSAGTGPALRLVFIFGAFELASRSVSPVYFVGFTAYERGARHNVANTPTSIQAADDTPSGLFETTGAFFRDSGESGEIGK